MEIIIIILVWLLFGILATMNLYYTTIKDWYNTFKEDPRIKDKNFMTLDYKIIFIIGGPVSFFILTIGILLNGNSKSFTYYYKIPKP